MLQRELCPHAASSALPSAERKTEGFGIRLGDAEVVSLRFSACSCVKDYCGLFCLCTTPERRREMEPTFESLFIESLHLRFISSRLAA